MLADSQLRLARTSLLVRLDLRKLDCRHNDLEVVTVVEESSTRGSKVLVLRFGVGASILVGLFHILNTRRCFFILRLRGRFRGLTLSPNLCGLGGIGHFSVWSRHTCLGSNRCACYCYHCATRNFEMAFEQ